ncbi:hypothetical protein [Micrococcus luteus]
MRPDSRVLSKAPNEQAVLVEFLDFECEGCKAAYPSWKNCAPSTPTR